MKGGMIGLLLQLLIAYGVNGQATQIQVDPTLPPVSKGPRPTLPSPAVNSSVCYKYVGCFSTFPPFDNAGGVLPSPPERVGTVILLYTSQNKLIGQQVDYKDKGVSLGKSLFRPKLPTKFVIHGFTQDEKETWLHTMKDALLNTGPMNVFIVGWGEGASAPDYPRAVANTRVVAKQIKLLIDEMLRLGSQLSRVHMIGHSLGAHISGYVGADYNGQIGRISGMDPAGPFFESYDETVRLNPSDALFVDVIHSNGKPIVEAGAGMFAPCGHVDFYPNGGRDQPGCPSLASGLTKILKLDFHGVGDVASCSHSRSHYLFEESIRNIGQGCSFVSIPCGGWDDYMAGKCQTCGENGCQELGYHSIEYAARGSFYLLTKGSDRAKAAEGQQFCGIQYEIIVTPAQDHQNIKGHIDLTIVGVQSSVNTPFQGSDSTLSGERKIIVVDYQPLGELQTVRLNYKRHGGWFFGIGMGVETWKLDHIIISNNGKRWKFCSNSQVEVKDGMSVEINICTN